jgi:hypothetical protein
MIRKPRDTRPGLKLLPDLVSYPGPVYNLRLPPGKGSPVQTFTKAERFNSCASYTDPVLDSRRPLYSAVQCFSIRKGSLPRPYKGNLSLPDDSPVHDLDGQRTSAASGDRSSALRKDYSIKTPSRLLGTESPGPGYYSPKVTAPSGITFPKTNRDLLDFKSRRSSTSSPRPQQSGTPALREIKQLRPVMPMKRVPLSQAVPKAWSDQDRKLQLLLRDFERRKAGTNSLV